MSGVWESLCRNFSSRVAPFPETKLLIKEGGSHEQSIPESCRDILQCTNVLSDPKQCVKKWHDKCSMKQLMAAALQGQTPLDAYATIKKIQKVYPADEEVRNGFRQANEALYPTTTDKAMLLQEGLRVHDQCLEQQPDNPSCLGWRAYYGYWYGQHHRNAKLPSLNRQALLDGDQKGASQAARTAIQKLYNEYIMNLKWVKVHAQKALACGEVTLGHYYTGMAMFELLKLNKENPDIVASSFGIGSRSPVDGCSYAAAATHLEKAYVGNPRSHCALHTALCHIEMKQRKDADGWLKKCLKDAERERSLRNMRICEDEGKRLW